MGPSGPPTRGLVSYQIFETTEPKFKIDNKLAI